MDDGARRNITVGRLVDQVHRALVLRDIHLVADENEAGHALGPEKGDGGIEHGEPDVLPAARSLPGKQGGGDRLGSSQGGDLVGDDDPEHFRPAGIPVGLNVRRARQRLDDRIVNPLMGVRPLSRRTR